MKAVKESCKLCRNVNIAGK